MRAMVFAAGLGTRLKPFTDEHPKALVEVGGIPMLQHVILKLKHFGITEIVVNVHHFANQIVDFLAENDNFGCDIVISDESQLLLDTGGGLLAARKWLEDSDGPIIVHNADIFTNLPLLPLTTTCQHDNALAALAVSNRQTSRYLLFDRDMRMRAWTNMGTGEVIPPDVDIEGLQPLAFSGVHAVSPKIFTPLSEFAPSGTPFSIMKFYISACSTHLIKGCESNPVVVWHDVGKPEALNAARIAANH